MAEIAGLPAVAPPRAAPPTGLAARTHRFVERVGEVWIGNLITVVSFVGRLARAIAAGASADSPAGPAARSPGGSGAESPAVFRAGSPDGSTTGPAPAVARQSGRVAEAARLTFGQAARTSLRSLFPVLGLGLLIGMGLGAAARAGGDFVRPVFDNVILVIVVRDAAPLLFALALAARTGASVAAKLAILPALRGVDAIRFEGWELQRQTLPHIAACFATAFPLFLVFVWCIVAGYEGDGSPLAALGAADFGRYFGLAPVWPPLVWGTGKALLFAAFVGVSAAALGVKAAERHASRPGEQYQLHYAVWESVMVSLLLCIGATMLFWQIEGPP
jgi:ABC-type transporter Mla maintaining outer membrane lipid asymmetry permease subunit MlaE